MEERGRNVFVRRLHEKNANNPKRRGRRDLAGLSGQKQDPEQGR